MPYRYFPDIVRQCSIVKLEGDIAIKKAMLEAYIEEQSSLLVDSFYLEDGEESTDKNASGDKNIFQTIFNAIGSIVDSIVRTVEYIFTGRSAEEVLNDPNKKVELKYDLNRFQDQGLRELQGETNSIIKMITGVTPFDEEQVRGGAEKAAAVAGVAGMFFTGKQIFGWIGGMKDRLLKGKKAIDETEKALEENYTRMDGGQRKTLRQKLGALRKSFTEKIVKPVEEGIKAISDNSKVYLKYGIFDKDTPEHIITKWKGTSDDKPLPKEVVAAMKISEKYNEVKDYVKTARDEQGKVIHKGVDKIGRNEDEVSKNFEAFVQRAQAHPEAIKKGESIDFFQDLTTIRMIKENHERKNGKKNNDAGEEGQQNADQNTQNAAS